MGCCIVTGEESDFFMCELRKSVEDVEHLGRAVEADFFSLNSSSSIIMFEGGRDLQENCMSKDKSIKRHESTEKTWEE
ncbi:hypothetical protein SteCoe_4480 [Stentor coeruleus]|uniref:Uncharacterized protein n=1 Tax=Stentor coeruleus TaxID=5963 RepID=A0A1R2CUT5_9CILI|nr:hypothetical protein SteCoe_4480 [Stentor coeruleus]